MSNKKQLIINFMSQVFYSVVNLAISFFLVPHIIESINATAYGFINLSNDFVNYASLITIALNSIAGRYITIAIHKKKKEEANIYFNSVIIANIIMSIAILIPIILFIIFMDNLLNIPAAILPDVRLLFIIVFVNFILSLITSVFTIATFTSNKLYLNSIASIISQVLRCIVLVALFGLFNSSVWFVGFASLIATTFTIIANIYFTKKLTPELKINFGQFKLEYIVEMVKNGVWNTVNKLSGILQNGLDLLISNVFVSSAAMGIIALPRTITSIIFSLFGSIASIFNPNIMQAYAKDDYESIKKQLSFAIKFTGTFSNVCIAIFIALGIEFYQLWVPTQDANFLYLLTILSLASLAVGIPVEPVYAVHTSTNQIKKPAIMTLILSVLTILIVILGIYLVDNEDMKIIIISATSSIVSLYRLLIYIPMYTAKILDEKKTYLYPVLFKCYLSLMLCIVINFIVKSILPLTNWSLFFASCFVLAIFNLLINIFMNFNGDEKEQFNEFFKKQFRLK